MKNIFKISFLILVFLGYACTDLDEELRDEFTEAFDPNNPGLGESLNTNKPVPVDGLNAAFSRLLNGTANHNSYFSMQEVSSDEMIITQKGGDWFDGGIWINMHEQDFRATNESLNNTWNDNYAVITQANLLLDGGLSTDGTAQIRVLRAFIYWRLMDLFGNVKLVVTPGVDVTQSTRLQAFNFIEAELLATIPDLRDGRAEYGRINQYGAYGILARLYLNAEVYTGTARWQDAIDAADEIINSGLYDLDPNYAAVFAPDNVENIEHIFIVPFDESSGPGMNFAQMTLHYPSQLTYGFQAQPWNGYSTLEEFYNTYDDADVRKAANFIVGPQLDLQGNPVLDVAFDPDDPDGAELNFTPFINELFPSGSRQGGARLGKFSFKIGQLPDADNDYTLIRLGGVLLDKAEAVARLNNNFSHPTTIALTNDIRARAGVSVYTSLTEAEFYNERGREMFQESLRRTQMIRFGTWGDAWQFKPAHSDAFKDIMPIPLDQINASAGGNVLVQNPGY